MGWSLSIFLVQFISCTVPEGWDRGGQILPLARRQGGPRNVCQGLVLITNYPDQSVLSREAAGKAGSSFSLPAAQLLKKASQQEGGSSRAARTGSAPPPPPSRPLCAEAVCRKNVPATGGVVSTLHSSAQSTPHLW